MIFQGQEFLENGLFQRTRKRWIGPNSKRFSGHSGPCTADLIRLRRGLVQYNTARTERAVAELCFHVERWRQKWVAFPPLGTPRAGQAMDVVVVVNLANQSYGTRTGLAFPRAGVWERPVSISDWELGTAPISAINLSYEPTATQPGTDGMPYSGQCREIGPYHRRSSLSQG